MIWDLVQGVLVGVLLLVLFLGWDHQQREHARRELKRKRWQRLYEDIERRVQ